MFPSFLVGALPNNSNKRQHAASNALQVSTGLYVVPHHKKASILESREK